MSLRNCSTSTSTSTFYIRVIYSLAEVGTESIEYFDSLYPIDRSGTIRLDVRPKSLEATPERCSLGILLQGHYPKGLRGMSRTFGADIRTDRVDQRS